MFLDIVWSLSNGGMPFLAIMIVKTPRRLKMIMRHIVVHLRCSWVLMELMYPSTKLYVLSGFTFILKLNFSMNFVDMTIPVLFP